jgi:hypothetical protein
MAKYRCNIFQVRGPDKSTQFHQQENARASIPVQGIASQQVWTGQHAL